SDEPVNAEAQAEASADGEDTKPRRRSRRRGRRGGRQQSNGRAETAAADSTANENASDDGGSADQTGSDKATQPEKTAQAEQQTVEVQQTTRNDSQKDASGHDDKASFRRPEPKEKAVNGTGKSNGSAAHDEPAPEKVGEGMAHAQPEEPETVTVEETAPPPSKPRGSRKGWWQRGEA
ncbi:MAG TPA: hypothetical protein VKA94_04465, partial [Hyphomicrobiales bacterium]|nr:hypothetical protein [Hyphomicrobiales bacterium]